MAWPEANGGREIVKRSSNSECPLPRSLPPPFFPLSGSKKHPSVGFCQVAEIELPLFAPGSLQSESVVGRGAEIAATAAVSRQCMQISRLLSRGPLDCLEKKAKNRIIL